MNRLEWILGILLVVMLLIVVGISVLLWRRPDLPGIADGSTAANVESETTDISTRLKHTAQLSYAAAQRIALDWHNDAVLFDATATWPSGATETELRSGVADWGYTFYSPDGGATTLVTVRDGEASQLSESPYSSSTPLADLGGWNLDSQTAIDIFLKEGGAEFMRDERPTTLIVKLTTDNPGGRLEWFLSLFAEASGRAFNMRIDATTGEILSVETVP